jgi:hypothetical protein
VAAVKKTASPPNPTGTERTRQPKLPDTIFCRWGISFHQQKMKFENVALFSVSLVNS